MLTWPLGMHVRLAGIKAVAFLAMPGPRFVLDRDAFCGFREGSSVGQLRFRRSGPSGSKQHDCVGSTILSTISYSCATKRMLWMGTFGGGSPAICAKSASLSSA